MTCPYCGKTISDAAQFCPECGQAIGGGQKNSDAERFWDKVRQESISIENEYRKKEEKQDGIKKAKATKAFAILSLCVAVVAIIVYAVVIFPSNKYNKAIKLYEEEVYSEAKVLFEELNGYKDSLEWEIKCDQKLTGIAYDVAVCKFEDGDYKGALEDFKNLGDYSNSEFYVGECELIFAGNADVGDNIVLGHYGSNKASIEWTVLEKSDYDILLISRYYVTSKVANGDQSLEYSDDRDSHDYHCWSQSTLREWLNDGFIKESFSENQIKQFITNTITTEEYNVDEYDGWSEEEITVTTEDKVYIPSKADVEHYNLKPVQSMRNTNGSPIEGWLRDRGHGIAFQSTLDASGNYGSEWHFYSTYGIRPIIRLKLADVEQFDNGVEDGESVGVDGSVDNAEDNESVDVDESIAVEIPDGALVVGGHSYYVYSNCNSWEEAEYYCESLGGHLATIESSDENTALFDYVKANFGGNAYFGFSDYESEGDWKWVTGERISYTNWHSGEPNGENSGEDFAMFYYKFDDGSWNDGDFKRSGSNFICEWDRCQ